MGGTTILSETPEIYGAEHLLTRRAVSREVGEKLVERIQLVGGLHRPQRRRDGQQPLPRQQARRADDDPGKIAGRGRQGRHRPPDAASTSSPNRSPRPASSTWTAPATTPARSPARSPAGANLIVFTTGRGSVSGYKPAPCIKLATNTEMYDRMTEDMDINCGDIIDGASASRRRATRSSRCSSRVASGEQTKSEELGFGGAEFVPWQIGAVM